MCSLAIEKEAHACARTRDLLYNKRDLLYNKRDLLYNKRDLLYNKRDLLRRKKHTHVLEQGRLRERERERERERVDSLERGTRTC